MHNFWMKAIMNSAFIIGLELIIVSLFMIKDPVMATIIGGIGAGTVIALINHG